MSELVVSSDDEASLQSSDCFEKIPLWTANGAARRFEVMSDEFSGRIPVTRLESWRQFTDLLEDHFFNRSGV